MSFLRDESPAPSAEQSIRLDFESGTLDGWIATRLAGPHSAVVQSEVVRAGRHACRFELRPGDYVADGYRAELRDPHNAPLGVPVWYGFSTLIPETYPSEPGIGCVLAQWHDQARLGEPSGKPPVALRYRDGDLVVTGAYDAVASPEPAVRHEFARVPSLARGRWHDVVLRAVWAWRSATEIDLWLNGDRIVSWRGRLGYENQHRGPYFKFGVYCSGPISRPHVVYHDAFSRGSGFDEVDPRAHVEAANG